jgi:hypothetical protein
MLDEEVYCVTIALSVALTQNNTVQRVYVFAEGRLKIAGESRIAKRQSTNNTWAIKARTCLQDAIV